VRRDPVFNRTKHRSQSIFPQTFPLIFPRKHHQKKKNRVKRKMGKYSGAAVGDKLFASVLCSLFAEAGKWVQE